VLIVRRANTVQGKVQTALLAMFRIKIDRRLYKLDSIRFMSTGDNAKEPRRHEKEMDDDAKNSRQSVLGRLSQKTRMGGRDIIADGLAHFDLPRPSPKASPQCSQRLVQLFDARLCLRWLLCLCICRFLCICLDIEVLHQIGDILVIVLLLTAT